MKGLANGREEKSREGIAREVLWEAEEISGKKATGEISEAGEEFPSAAEITGARAEGRETAQGISTDGEDFRK